MRVLVPRRFIRLGILLAVLCLTPVVATSAFAYPKPSVDYGDNPPPPRGDGDGTVVKGAHLSWSPSNATPANAIRGSFGSSFARYLRLVRMGYGLRWYW
jgi:hypothetical protein